MFFLPIQASRRLISIKKKNKMFISYESAPNRQFHFGMPSGFVRDFTYTFPLSSIYSAYTLDVRTISDEIVRYKSSAIMNC